MFAALAAAETAPEAHVVLLEAAPQPLAKVRISGGGRCNVTHACFEPRELIKCYPRGARELLGPFTRFGPRDTIAWFESRGVALKVEADGRMFPTTDDSATIIDALLDEVAQRRVDLRLRTPVRHIEPASDGGFVLHADGSGRETINVDRLIVAPGGLRGAASQAMLAPLGHSIEPPVPSLFTFHIDDPRLKGLEGLSVPNARTAVSGMRLEETGPLLVTHWGLSGPAILKLSAWGARKLAECQYRFTLRVSWVARAMDQLRNDLLKLRASQPRRHAANANPWELPARLWNRLLEAAQVSPDAPWSGVSNAALQAIERQVGGAEFAVAGKSLNKDEFVTCGGIRLKEVDFKTLESRLHPGLHFAGEVLDIDGITGGFNFQAAWTTGWIAGRAAALA